MYKSDRERIQYSNVLLEETVEIINFGKNKSVDNGMITDGWFFCSRNRNDESRVVYVSNKHFDSSIEETVYPDNTIISSKYTILTFLPKNLFEQFQRIANFYFICVVCIQFVVDTPVTPLTSILPLSFVISVTAIKQGYEDWLRHIADNEVNLRDTLIIRNGIEEPSRAMDIKVGDIVKVQRNEEFPCDLVMLSSEDPLGQCYITTANLDGETNLKTFSCLSETRHLNTSLELHNLRARITCMPQVTDLYRFEGVMEFGPGVESKPLGPENLLLRGARLKNTDYIYGCAVYTGKDTKMTLNSKAKTTKFSRVERKLNHYLLVFLIVLLVESVVSTGLMFWFEDTYGIPWYVPKDRTQVEVIRAVEHSLAFMVLYNYVIPISLYVTVEMQKFLGSLYFGMDIEMYDPTINECAQANTSDLNEELGQVEYLFTDKTGTLTENIMVFRRCCIGDRQFEIVDGVFCERLDTDTADLSSPLYFTNEMNEFFKVLVLCHTVRLESELRHTVSSMAHNTSQDPNEYHASSPDEKALVTACCRLGVVYRGNCDNILEVSFHNVIRKFKLLQTLPFDPTRKRMSIIIQEDNGEYFLLCKGAEIAILDRIVDGDAQTTMDLVTEYALLGLRTLAIAQRKLSFEEFTECDKKLNEAKLSMVSRDDMLAVAYSDIEQKLTLLGATAVEDKLQDQVPQTIEALRKAGIKVWVLTGDKEETAVNISHAAGHFHTDMQELRLTHVSRAEDCEPHLQELMSQTSRNNLSREYALTIDGQSLHFALKYHKPVLLELCLRCVAVLCCRMSPLQKAEVVSMIKHSPLKPVTAAIGDGANDVSMIQEADVGLGIMGKEGRQAVRNSDYALGKFKFLRRALLLHGHLYYRRIAVLVQYFFYKNVAWITGQVFYACFNSFSQQSLFDPFYLIFYNLTFTSFPILVYGLFEQHISKDELLNNPELYRRITRNATMSWWMFLKWNFLGNMFMACCCGIFGYFLLQLGGVSLFESGVNLGNADFGSIIFFSCVVTVNVKLLLETYYWCLPVILAYIATLMCTIILCAFYTNVFFPSTIVNQKDIYKSLGQIYSSPVIWLAMLILVTASLLPDVVLRVIRDTADSKSRLHRLSLECPSIETLMSIFQIEKLRYLYFFQPLSPTPPDTFTYFIFLSLLAVWYNTSFAIWILFPKLFTGRKISIVPISYTLSHPTGTSQSRSHIESLELQSRSSRSSCSTTSTGFDNPVLSLSDENILSNGAGNQFYNQDIPEQIASDRMSSSQISKVITGHSNGNFAGSSDIKHVHKDDHTNNTIVEQKPTNNALHSNDSVVSVDLHHSNDDILPSIDSSEISGSFFQIQTLPTTVAVIENTEHKHESHIRSPSQSGDYGDSKDIKVPTPDNYDETINYTSTGTEPVDFAKPTGSDHSYITITPFSPSPSHATFTQHHSSAQINPVGEYPNTHSIATESSPL